jgi:hypothetical protein
VAGEGTAVPARAWGRDPRALSIGPRCLRGRGDEKRGRWEGDGGGGRERGHPGVDTFHALLGLFVCVGLMGQNDF